MKTSEILTKAAEIMMERGHGKGHYVGRDGRVCILGACAMASDAFESPLIVLPSTIPGSQILHCLLGVLPQDWNDHCETTETMAIGALHEAAILAKEQGD